MALEEDRKMEESLSALVDGELERAAARGLLAHVGGDHGLSRCWADYHLIGDVLRGTGVSVFAFERFRTALAAEPAICLTTSGGSRPAANVPLRLSLSFAAAAAAAVLVGWMAWPMTQNSPAAADKIAAAREHAVQAVPAAASVPSAHGFEDYLLAHQRFAPSFAMQGAAPYVRLVGDDAPKGRK